MESEFGQAYATATYTRPLREEPHGDDDHCPRPVRLVLDHREEADVLVDLPIDLDRFHDLGQLELYDRVRGVPVGVVLDEHCRGLLDPPLLDEPTWGFGQEPHEEDLQDGGKHLEEGRDTPGPICRGVRAVR